MDCFDIGWSPAGWVRGNPLGLINNGFRGGSVAAVYYKAQSPYGEVPEIGAIQFTARESAKVDAWLEWWYKSCEVAT